MLESLTQQTISGLDLSAEQVAIAVSALTNEGIPAEIKAGFLSALAQKGETPAEIAAFARELRALSVVPPIDPETRHREILDVCGTGGDRLNTFNISTTVALLAAAAGVTVAKHGNRAITSKSGSADVLEALGIRIDLSPKEAAQSLRERQFAFFFAQKYHPAFKNIAPARKLCADRGQRTIFNFLGPLLNPVQPSAQLLGVPRTSLCEPIARVLQSLGTRRAMVVCGEVPGSHVTESSAFLDELSTLGDSTVAEFYQDRAFTCSVISPTSFGLPSAKLADLAGGDRDDNARILTDLLAGRDRGPKRDAVLLNAGAALFVAGRSRSVTEGMELAGETIDNGAALAKIEQLRA